MYAEGPTRVRQLTAALPLAVLVGAGVVGLGSPVPGPGPGAVADQTEAPVELPVIDDNFDAPASVSSPRDDRDQGRDIVSVADNSDIPSTALSAYHKAELVMQRTDRSCGVTWSVLAAIGKVESDHGRYGGSSLDESGRATPGILGIALDGTRNTRVITDTDAGQLDGDQRYDRAVGPMQFIPGTWSMVGVDADGDGVRNPQDIDDSALAAAVYLCNGTDDLSTDAGLRNAIGRYNHSDSYVDLVMELAAQYATGSYVDGTTPTATPDDEVFARGTDDDDQVNPGDDTTTDPGDNNSDDNQIPATDGELIAGSDSGGGDFDPEGTEETEEFPDISEPRPTGPSDPSETPTQDSTGGSTDGPTDPPSETDSPSQEPSQGGTNEPAHELPYVDPTLPDADPAVEQAYLDSAVASCTEQGYTDDPNAYDDFDSCVGDSIITQRASTGCANAGLTDDPARNEDDFDLCVLQALAVAQG